MDLIFVSGSPDASRVLQQAASANGHQVLRQLAARPGFREHVQAMRPDAVIFVGDRVDRCVLQEMADMDCQYPVPVLMFTGDGDRDTIDAAVGAGVTSYVVDCMEPDRLDVLLHVTLARFRNRQRILQELNRTKKTLQERKSVEKAKGIIMQQKRLSEDQAYRSLQKLAMDRNKRMGEIAEQIIAASEVLV